ncbi:MAG: hypothetical protein QXT77_07420 [Candidatus Methanomethylicaceae archaeon]
MEETATKTPLKTREEIIEYINTDITNAISMLNVVRSDKNVFDALCDRMYNSYVAHETAKQQENG